MSRRPESGRERAAPAWMERAWFSLTLREQQAVVLVLTLFLIGVIARWRYVL